VFEDLKPTAVKTGMLHSRGIVRIVARFFKRAGRPPLVVDPVMIATSGSSLIKTSAVKGLMEELLPLARIVTPNLAEAGVLAGRPIRSLEDMRETAKQISTRFGCAALVKGGHLPQRGKAIDVFRDGSTELVLESRYVPGMRTHGTGCTLSAAIAGYLALGHSLPDSVVRAKEYICCAIADGRITANHFVLGNGAAGMKAVRPRRSRRTRILRRMR
jgi:hydroxymethylpyrimidine/phosphomethylpyrimidine kinase